MNDEGGGASRSTEPAAGTSAATDVSLREYMIALLHAAEKREDLRFQAMKDQVEAAFNSSQLAIDKADQATEKRFEGVNEFRAALSDQATRFVTNQTLDALGDKLQSSIERNREDLDNLARRLDLREGQDTGTKLTTGAMVGGLTVLVLIIGVIVAAANYLSGT